MKILGIEALNSDQYMGLANLCFDMAKAALIGAILSPIVSETNTLMLNAIRGVFIGVASTYAALILLKLKSENPADL